MNIQVQKGPKVTKEIYIKLNWLHSAGGKVFSAGDVTHELSSDLYCLCVDPGWFYQSIARSALTPVSLTLISWFISSNCSNKNQRNNTLKIKIAEIKSF